MKNERIIVYLPINDNPSSVNDLKIMLEKANMEVVYASDTNNESEFLEEDRKALLKANCSLHILGNIFGKTLQGNPSLSLSKHQFIEAKKKLNSNPEYKMFIWYPQHLVGKEKEILQEAFIDEIRYGIEKNMIFTTTESPIQLVDDIRNMMTFEQKTYFDVKETEIFLIFNQLDENEAEEVVDMLSDIVEVEKLNIIQNSETDYSELCNQQIGKSKLAVIYFKETSDWALPFVQQVWKKVGGAGSHTPILLIGTEDPEFNKNKVFNAPKVISLIVSGDLIPLEIKVQYDKAINN